MLRRRHRGAWLNGEPSGSVLTRSLTQCKGRGRFIPRQQGRRTSISCSAGSAGGRDPEELHVRGEKTGLEKLEHETLGSTKRASLLGTLGCRASDGPTRRRNRTGVRISHVFATLITPASGLRLPGRDEGSAHRTTRSVIARFVGCCCGRVSCTGLTAGARARGATHCVEPDTRSVSSCRARLIAEVTRWIRSPVSVAASG